MAKKEPKLPDPEHELNPDVYRAPEADAPPEPEPEEKDEADGDK